jgi:hypothetical protein
MNNKHTCDFLALINLYKSTNDTFRKGQNTQYRNNRGPELTLETFFEVRDMIRDIKKRMNKKIAFQALMKKN